MRGQVLGARYRIDDPIGAGGMGSVWRAYDLELRRVVAVKKAIDGDGEVIRREARLGASLQHPNVIAVFDVIVDGDERWLVMEYLPSRSLAQVLREDGPLPPQQAAHVGAQVAEALHAMHRNGLVHRDITPGNVLVGDNGTVKLTDLGVAMWAHATVTGQEQVAGTPGYTAPEVTDGHLASPASDVFSLGATLADVVRPGGPLAPVLAALTDPKPARRPTAEQARESLLSGVPKRRNRRAVLVAAAALSLVAIVAAVVVLWPARVPTGPEIVGDALSADPCALINPTEFRHLGPSWTNREDGDFSSCELVIELADGDRLLVTYLLQNGPNGGSGDTPPPAPDGEIVVDRPEQEWGQCSRIVRLPVANRLVIQARYQGNWAADACKVADLPVDGVVAKLGAGPMPRRDTSAFPPDSLAHTKACGLVHSNELPGPLAGSRAVPGLRDWECSWSVDGGRVRALIFYHRRAPITAEPEKVMPVQLSPGREGFLLPTGWGEGKCLVEVPHRTYVTGDGTTKVEYAGVVIRDDQTSEVRCAAALSLAKKVSLGLAR